MTNPTARPFSLATTEVSAKSLHHNRYAYGELRSSFRESRAIRHSCAPSALAGDSIKCVPDILRKRNREFSRAPPAHAMIRRSTCGDAVCPVRIPTTAFEARQLWAYARLGRPPAAGDLPRRWTFPGVNARPPAASDVREGHIHGVLGPQRRRIRRQAAASGVETAGSTSRAATTSHHSG